MILNSLSIASWNINGLNSKIDNPDFINLVEKHDVIFLLETFADVGCEDFVIDGYTSSNIAQSGKPSDSNKNKATRGCRG